jgi:RimJ/RimL family protein N-acetyltransferase
VQEAPDTPVTVHATGFVLRAYSPADLPALLEAFADPEIARWNPGPADQDRLPAAVEWISRRNDWADGSHVSWAVAGPDDQLFGSVSVHKIDRSQGDAEVGYWTAPWARGAGHTTGAVRSAVRFAFEELGLRRLSLYHAVENQGSCRVATAAGFRLEGELRLSYRYPDGAYHDEHLHARLATDIDEADEVS